MNNFYRNAEMIFNNEPETPNRIEQWEKVSRCRFCGCTLPDCESDYCDPCWAEEQAYRAETKKLTPELNRLKDLTLYAVFFLLAGYMVLFGSCKPAHAEEINDQQAINAIIGEAEDQGYKGMLAVACAIRNRGTLKGVYGVNAPRVKQKKYSQKIYLAAKQAWEESLNCDITNGADHWENVKAFGTPSWAKSMVVCFEHKDHRFYKKAGA